MKIGLMLNDNGAGASEIESLVAQVQQAEKDGFDTAWMPQIFGVDAMMALALAGTKTSRIELGTAVVPTYPRHPVVMASQALTTQAACGGRFSLGIGLSHQVVIEMMFGLSFAKPYTHMKEYMAVLAPLIRDGAAGYAGSEFRVNANVNVRGSKPCPILLAALAPKMLALAGSVGDGTITWMTGVKTVREHTAPSIRDAASKAGRPAPRIVVGLPVAVTDDPKAAREVAGNAFQIYGGLPSYRAMLDREGAAGPADVAIVGDEDSVGEQLQRVKDAGATDFLAAVFPGGGDPAESMARTRKLLQRVQAAG